MTYVTTKKRYTVKEAQAIASEAGYTLEVGKQSYSINNITFSTLVAAVEWVDANPIPTASEEIGYIPTCANCPLGTDLGRNRIRCAAAHNGHNPVRHANDQADIACEEAIEEYHKEVAAEKEMGEIIHADANEEFNAYIESLTTDDKWLTEPISANPPNAIFHKSAPRYARVRLAGSLFDKKVFLIAQEDEEGVMLATELGDRWFGFQHIERINPAENTTDGNYAGLSRQIRKHWEALDKNPEDLIAEMKAHRPPQPQWDAQRYNPLTHLLQEKIFTPYVQMPEEENPWVKEAERYGFKVMAQGDGYQIHDRITKTLAGELIFNENNWWLMTPRHSEPMRFEGASEVIEYLAGVASFGNQLT